MADARHRDPKYEAPIEPCTRGDFHWILDHFGEFWDDEATRPRHHPMFVHEFADSAWVVRDGDALAAYMFAFIATSASVGYIHMVAVHRTARRRGLARRLYAHFTEFARERGCTRLKATVAPHNRLSLDFHLGLGMRAEGGSEDDDVPPVMDYAGPGIDRVVLWKEI